MDSLITFNTEVDTLAVTLEAFNQGFISKEDLRVLTAINPEVSMVERHRALLEHVQTASLEEKLLVFSKHSSESEIETSAVQAKREGLIKADVCDHLKSLQDSEVPYAMRSRYMLQSVHRSITAKFMKRVLEVVPFDPIKEHPLKFAEDAQKTNLIDKSVLDHLINTYPTGKRDKITLLELERIEDLERSQLKNLVEEVFSFTLPSSIVDDSLIDPEQLPKVYELLVNYAFKWRSIGMALNFQPQDLENIQAAPLLLQDAPKSYLSRLLEDWLLKKLKHTLPPSVKCLKKALNSQTVGLGSLANKIDKANLCKNTFQTVLNPSYCMINVESPFLNCDAVFVKEGSSTLLEIQIAPCKGKRTYQWLKDGVKLTSDSSTEPILCLHQADIALGGCELSCQVKPVTTSAPVITVNVSCELDQYRGDLASMYLAQPEVPEDTWPPVADLKYINLALVKQNKLNYNSKCAYLTIHGDLDDILLDKQIIAYNDKDFFKSMRSGKLILIEGRPGSGKTTFVHKLTQDWAIKTGGAIRLLLLVSLRVLNTFSKIDLSDILKLFEHLQVSKDIIEQRLGKGVCFIFDGFDEFSPQDENSSVIHKIISKTYLHKSIVIVASRHAAIAKLRHKADIVIEVVGFLHEQIMEYFDHYPFSTPTKSGELKLYLEIHPNILHICYLPIHATMVAFLFQEIGKVSTTETEMYTHFTRLTLIRNLTKNRKFEPVNIDLHSLTGEESLYFKQVCMLAFEKTISSKQVLDQNEVDSHLQVKKSIDSTLGLITVDRTAGLYGYKSFYTFMHLTFQEYLAAYHITTLSDEEQMKLIQEYGDRNHMLVVWKFYCGLTTIKDDNKFKTILSKSKDNTLFQIQCGYETQQKKACAQLLKSVHYHFKLEDKYLSTPDFTALGYVTNIAETPTILSLLNCNMNVEAIDALLSEVEDRARGSVHALHITTAVIDNSQIECMRKLLANLNSLKTLSLEAHTNAVSDASVSDVELSGLTDLSLKNIYISPLLSASLFVNLLNLRVRGATKWQVETLKYLKLATNLQLLEVSIDTENFDFFCECAQNWRKLKELDVAFHQNNLFNPTLNFLGHSERLEILTIKNFILNSSVAMDLMIRIKKGLEHDLNIQKLDLSNRFIKTNSSELFKTLSADFMVNLSLKELRIDFFHIGDSGVELLSSKLPYSSSLVKLSLPGNSITSSGGRVLAANLHYCTNLEKLDLENNRIGHDGAHAIVSALSSCEHFKELNLLQNPCHNFKADQEYTFSVHS